MNISYSRASSTDSLSIPRPKNLKATSYPYYNRQPPKHASKKTKTKQKTGTVPQSCMTQLLTRQCSVLKKRCRQSYYVNPWNIAKGNLDISIETKVVEDNISRPYDYYGVLDDCYAKCAETLLEKTIMCPLKFNPFALDRFTGKPVMFFGMYLFEKCGFFKGLQPLLDPIDAMKVLRDIEENYHYKNTYHNQLHTVDVTQSFYVLMHSAGFKEKFSLSQPETMIALFAALFHDLDHPGNTSKYVCLFKHDFFFRFYNKKFHDLRGLPEKPIEFTLENHHAAMANSVILNNKILEKAGCSIKEQELLMTLLCDLIHATDMERHKALVEKFQTHLIRVTSARCTDQFIRSIKTDALQLLIKCADISNPFRDWHIAATWASLVCEEFYQQDDKEKLVKANFMTQDEIKLLPPMTGAADRTKHIYTIQIGFISFVVEPLLTTFSILDGTRQSQQILQMVQKNLRRWKVAEKLHQNPDIRSYFGDTDMLKYSIATKRKIEANFMENKKVTIIVRTG